MCWKCLCRKCQCVLKLSNYDPFYQFLCIIVLIKVKTDIINKDNRLIWCHICSFMLWITWIHNIQTTYSVENVYINHVENHVENFKACWKCVANLKVCLKHISRHVENVLKISRHVENIFQGMLKTYFKACWKHLKNFNACWKCVWKPCWKCQHMLKMCWKFHHIS